jgi:hypothetical protein
MKLQRDYATVSPKIDEEYIEELRAGLMRLTECGWKIVDLKNHCRLNVRTIRDFLEDKREPQEATIKAIEDILKYCHCETGEEL